MITLSVGSVEQNRSGKQRDQYSRGQDSFDICIEIGLPSLSQLPDKKQDASSCEIEHSLDESHHIHGDRLLEMPEREGGTEKKHHVCKERRRCSKNKTYSATAPQDMFEQVLTAQ